MLNFVYGLCTGVWETRTKLKLKLVEEWDKLHNNGEENEMNRAIAIGSIHPPAVRGKR